MPSGPATIGAVAHARREDRLAGVGDHEVAVGRGAAQVADLAPRPDVAPAGVERHRRDPRGLLHDGEVDRDVRQPLVVGRGTAPEPALDALDEIAGDAARLGEQARRPEDEEARRSRGGGPDAARTRAFSASGFSTKREDAAVPNLDVAEVRLGARGRHGQDRRRSPRPRARPPRRAPGGSAPGSRTVWSVGTAAVTGSPSAAKRSAAREDRGPRVAPRGLREDAARRKLRQLRGPRARRGAPPSPPRRPRWAGARRSHVSASRLFSERSGRNCLGRASVESGQSRVPPPPAMRRISGEARRTPYAPCSSLRPSRLPAFIPTSIPAAPLRASG